MTNIERLSGRKAGDARPTDYELLAHTEPAEFAAVPCKNSSEEDLFPSADAENTQKSPIGRCPYCGERIYVPFCEHVRGCGEFGRRGR